MEPGVDAVMQENVAKDEPPMQPPVQGLPPNHNPNPTRKEFFSRPPYHSKAARHRKPVVTQMCEICNIELIGQVVIDAHMKGSKHAKKLKAKELLSQLIYKCEICNVALNSPQQLEVHNAGAKHIAKAKESTDSGILDGTAAQTGAANVSNADVANDAQKSSVQAEKLKSGVNPQELSCTVCNVNVNSPQQLEQHLASKKHKDREAGRLSQRPAPYQRAGHAGRGGRGGLGSHGPPGRGGGGGGGGGKASSGKYTSLSTSFKSAGYSNSFIKPEGGVILPSNCGTNNRGPSESHPHIPPHGNRTYNTGGQFKNRGNFGSLTPYISTDTARGGFNARGGAAVSQPAWTNPAPMYGGYGYDYSSYAAGYNYSGYENAEGYAEGYAEYGMMQTAPPAPPPPPPPY